MDQNTSAPNSRVMEELKRVIVNINRNLYEWREIRRGKTFTISYSEVYGLTKNWFVRGLRTIFGAADVDRLLRRGNLVISVDDAEFRIRAVYLKESNEKE